MIKLVLLRHGESIWNKENRFTGWVDVGLSEKGISEAKEAGQILKKDGYTFDITYTSVLKRATDTLKIAIEEMDHGKIPVIEAWQLNERHYGSLQGLNKSEMAQKYGEEQVLIWRRSYDIRPPALEKTDTMFPGNDSRYKKLKEKELPLTECLKDTVARVIPYWKKQIVPQLKKGQKIMIAAHGNSLRALVKHLDNVPDKEIVSLNIPTGVPLVYELDQNLKPIRHYYLGDPKEIEAKINAVASQGKSKK